jgi:hypothetical protein
VSQTTLEQIFQSFANQKIDNDKAKKLLFKKLIGSARAELYSDRNNVNAEAAAGKKRNNTNVSTPASADS